MDKLSIEEQAELKKCSSDRLKLKLCDAGLDEKVVSATDRSQLLTAAAEHKAKSGASISASIVERELHLREQEIMLKQAELAARAEERQKEAK